MIITLLFVLFNLGSLSNSTWHVPETEASPANLSRVVDCFIGEIHHSRGTGSPEQPQREVRRPLAQSRPSAAPRKSYKAVANPIFHPFLPRKPHYSSTDQVTTSLRKSIAASPSLLPARGLGAAPGTQDVPREIASLTVPQETIGR